MPLKSSGNWQMNLWRLNLMAKAKLPSTDSFLAMLDRIPESSLDTIAPVTEEIKPPAPIVQLVPKSSPAIETNITQQTTDGMLLTTTDRQNNRPSDSQTVRPSNGQTVQQSDTGTVRPYDQQTSTPSATYNNTPSDIQDNKRSDSLLSITTDGYSDVSPPVEMVDQYIPLDVLNLTRNQAEILEYLDAAGGLTSYRQIHESTDISQNSARVAIAALVKKGFMAAPLTVRGANYQGFSYTINNQMIGYFNKAGGLKRYQNNRPSVIANNRPSDRQTIKPSDCQTDRQFDSQSLHSSSDFKELNPTTTNSQQTVGQSVEQTNRPPEHFIVSGPEMFFWQEVGLQERQAQQWCQDFELIPADLKQQLAWARWDLIENGQQEKVGNALNWFFGALKKTAGCYPPAKGYRSPTEIRAEKMREQMTRNKEAEFELAWQQLIADPESELYKELVGQLNSFTREFMGKSDQQSKQVVETELKELLKIKLGV